MRPLNILFTSLVLLFALATATPSHAASKLELDNRVQAALQRLYSQQSEAQALGNKAVAILVFPQILKAGVAVGGEFGEGSLLVNGQPSGYYRSTALSVGLQMGVQARSEVIMFMTEGAYQDFIARDGWKAGVDGSIAVVQFGVGKEIDTQSIRDPIIGFVFGNKGLMYNLSIEGSKLWKIKK
jgi:lipid-binding SYLF domain-containing protein